MSKNSLKLSNLQITVGSTAFLTKPYNYPREYSKTLQPHRKCTYR